MLDDRSPDDLKDIELECRVCDEKFDFIVMEQRTQIRLGFENSPTKCKVHRGHKLCFKWRDETEYLF